MRRSAARVVLLALLTLSACGDDKATEPAKAEAPPWAKVAPEQIAEAKKHDVPVAFENDLGMRFVLIPAGTFLMGLDMAKALSGTHDVGENQHRVTFTRPVYVQTGAVTVGMFARFQRDVGDGHRSELPASAHGQPQSGVSWHEATAFAAWFSGFDKGRSYRLPTDAEWEYACRSGEERATGPDLVPYFSSRDTDAPSMAATADAKRAEAGSPAPNPWGLRDMLDDTYEWCGDWGKFLSREPVEDPQGPEKGAYKVVRGGTPTARRFIWRDSQSSEDGPMRIGFRLVSPLPESSK